MQPPMRRGFPPRLVKHGVFPRTRNGFSQPGHVSMTTRYRLPSRATPPCAGLPVTKKNRNKRHLISCRALLEHSARTNTDCSIYPGMYGNGRTPALFDNRLTQRATPLALLPPIVGCEPSKANTVPM